MTFLLTISGVVVLVLAARSDIEGRRIANGFVVAMLILGLLRIVVSPPGAPDVDIAADVLASLGLLAAGLVLFGLGIMGGGDVKLVTATALWLGAAHVPRFLLLTALAGGVLAAAFLFRRLIGATGAASGETLPYGVAIAFGGIITATLIV